LELLGGFPKHRCPLRPKTLDSEMVGHIEKRKLVFWSEQDVPVPAYLLIPKVKGKLPALLCLHGHGNGKDDVIGLDYGDEARRQHIRRLNYDYAWALARRGYVVLAMDARGWGERAHRESPGKDRCDLAFFKGMMIGLNPLRCNLWDAMRCVDLLASLAQVETERIGAIGLSQGGTHTLFLSALDERIRACVVSGYLSTYKRLVLDYHGVCGSQFVPELLRYGEMAEVACLVAPRPMLFENGTKDTVIPFAGAAQEFKRIQRLYKMLGVPERVKMDVFEGDHRFSGRLAYRWFDKWLKGRG